MTATNDTRHDDLPIACTLTDASELARRGDEAADRFRASETRELSDGYEFRFAGTAAQVDWLLAFVRAERECCRFFHFELAFEPDLGPVTLRLRGPEGVKAFVERAFVIAG
jgi:hypothetical protein